MDQHVHTTNNHTSGVLPRNTYFLFPGKYYKLVHGAAMGFPISHLITTLFIEEFELNTLISASHPLPMANVCGLHICHPAGKTQSTVTTTHQLTWSKYTVHHSRTKPRRIPAFPGHFSFSRSQQHSTTCWNPLCKELYTTQWNSQVKGSYIQPSSNIHCYLPNYSTAN